MEVQVCNTSKELIDFLKGNYVGNVSSWQPKLVNRKRAYKWYMIGESAKKLLEKVHPFLVSKKKQAELAFTFQEMLTESMLKGTELTQEDIDKRFEIIDKMHQLNAKEGDRQWTQKSDLKAL